jgi:hypothetical protein
LYISSAQDLGGVHHGIHDLLIPGAATGVAVFVEPLAHIVPAGVWFFVQQGLAGNDKTRCTETALDRAVDDKGQLQRMHMVGRAHAFDGGDRGAIGHFGHLGDA